MYLPTHFEEKDKKEIEKLLEQFPLATLVCFFDDEFIANHIPMIWNKEGEFIGHIAKSNNLHRIFPNGTRAIAIFKAEDSYISPNWYPTKQEIHRHVPTWNYQVVHLHGSLSFFDSRKDKFAAVGKLTKFYEKQYSGEKAWKMSDAPKDYMDQMLENIVAFKFKVERITAKSKISQNREKVDFISVKEKMEFLNKSTLANAMNRILEEN